MALLPEAPDGMIPAHLLGNMWAQEWGNIYDIAAPTGAEFSWPGMCWIQAWR